MALTEYGVLRHILGMTLHDWRLMRNMTVAAAAEFFGIPNARTYHRYETGENRPDAPLVEHFVKATDGSVTLADMHATRLSWLGAKEAAE